MCSAGEAGGVRLREQFIARTSIPRESDHEKRRVRSDLADLRAMGLAVTTGHGRGARWWRR